MFSRNPHYTQVPTPSAPGQALSGGARSPHPHEPHHQGEGEAIRDAFAALAGQVRAQLPKPTKTCVCSMSSLRIGRAEHRLSDVMKGMLLLAGWNPGIYRQAAQHLAGRLDLVTLAVFPGSVALPQLQPPRDFMQRCKQRGVPDKEIDNFSMTRVAFTVFCSTFNRCALHHVSKASAGSNS